MPFLELVPEKPVGKPHRLRLNAICDQRFQHDRTMVVEHAHLVARSNAALACSLFADAAIGRSVQRAELVQPRVVREQRLAMVVVMVGHAKQRIGRTQGVVRIGLHGMRIAGKLFFRRELHVQLVFRNEVLRIENRDAQRIGFHRRGGLHVFVVFLQNGAFFVVGVVSQPGGKVMPPCPDSCADTPPPSCPERLRGPWRR